jgi:hypothetical protein
MPILSIALFFASSHESIHAHADLAPNSVPLSFRIGRPDPPVAPDPRVTTDRSPTDRSDIGAGQ